jgi:CheY-like chemotaxis protein
MEKKHVLLVDDDSIFQMLGTKALHRVGVADTRIRQALNGRQALEILKDPAAPRPDVILLDLNMPIMNGFEFLEAFNKLTPSEKNDTKVIVVTSSSNQVDIDKAKSLGANEYLIKPLQDEQLTAVLKAPEK